jgi:hypothetical protein
VLRKLFVALALIAAVVYFLKMSDDTAATGITLVDPRDAPPVEATGDGAAADVNPGGPESTEQALPPVPRNVHLLGSVTRIDGTPVAGLHLEHRHPYLKTALATSGADGAFGIDVEEARGELVLVADDWLLLGGERFVLPAQTEGYALIVAPSMPLAGRVIDPQGVAVEGATVRAFAPSDALTPLGIVATPLEDPRQSAFTDALGNFKLAAVPVVPGLLVSVTLTGYVPIEQPLGSNPGDVLQIVLRRQ